MLLKEAQDLLSSVRPAAAPTPAVAPGPPAVPIPVVPAPPAPTHRVPPHRPSKRKSVRASARKGLRKFRDRFKLLLAKFTRAGQGPMTLSRGLVAEREENAELTERRDALFSHVQSDGGPSPL